MFPGLATLLRKVFTRRRAESELDEELQFHLEMETQAHLERGVPAAEARRLARRDLGGQAQTTEAVRQIRTLWVEALVQDLRWAARAIRRSSPMSAAIVVTLALGVGAGTAMFSLVDALMFKPPDLVASPGTLVTVPAANYVAYADLAVRARSLDMFAYTRQTLSLGGGADAIAINVECVTERYWSVLGVAPALGRAFSTTEAGRGGAPVAIISHDLWATRFPDDPAVVGRALSLAGKTFSIIGIAPRGFHGVRAEAVDAWIALPASPEACAFTGTNLLASSGGAWLSTVGRVRQAYTLDQAQAEIAILNGLEPTNLGRAGRLEPLMDSLHASGGRNARVATWLAAGAAALLLIVCANVAGLLSIRALDRQREIVVRMQLGARRSRLFRQLLLEHLVLLSIGGIAALGTTDWLWTLLRPFFPDIATASVFGPRALALLAGCLLFAGVLSCVLPALQASKTGTTDLRSGPGLSRDRSGLRRMLLVTQTAFALALVVNASLFASSVGNVTQQPGFDIDRVIVATVNLRQAGIRRSADAQAVFDTLLQRARLLPAVEAAALTSTPPLDSGPVNVLPSPVGRPGRPVRPRLITYITPDYFAVVGTRLVKGRSFSSADTASSPPVAIVDESFADVLWPGQSVLNRCVSVTSGSSCVTVVGISEARRIADLAHWNYEVFYPLAQGGQTDIVTQALLVRPRATPEEALGRIAAAIQSAAPQLPALTIRPMKDLADNDVRSWRVGQAVFGLFGILAVVFALCGIYTSVAFTTRRRTAEIGLRIALGATPVAIVRTVAVPAVATVGLGWLLGVLATAASSRYIEALLYQVEPLNLWAIGLASLILAAAGVLGCAVPAFRAVAVDPVVALRQN